MSETPLVSVVVVNWNGRKYLEACYNALRHQTYPLSQIEHIFVDNGSTDGSVEYMRANFPDARIIANQTNTGFAHPNNQGIRIARGTYIATLNNDTAVSPGWLAALVSELESHPEAGMAASLMRFYDRPEMVNSAGIDMNTVGIAWDRLGGKPVTTAQMPCEVIGACGGAALYRKSMLDEVGLFDEDFFAYLEDVDLAWRAQLMGWRCRYTPQADVLHIHSATSGEGSPLKNFLLGRNKLWTVAKCYPAPEVWRWLPLIAFYDLASVQYRLLRSGDTSPLRGRLAGLRGILKQLPKRSIIQRQVRPGQPERIHDLLAKLEDPLSMLKRYRYLQKRAVPSVE